MALLSELPPRESFTTTRGYTYSYIHISPPTSPKKPTLILLHGFPSHIPDWIHQIAHFSHAGHGVLVPDLLGYGQSSKPQAADAYRLKPMSDDITELLDHLSIDTVIGTGHDFGSTLLSRLGAYHPTRLAACVFLAVGPPKLGTPFNVDAINAMTRKALGYEMLGYIPFVARDPSAQALMEKNEASVMSLLFCADESKLWKQHFRPLGAFEEFVARGARVEVGEWYGEELRTAHGEAFGCEGGYACAKGWYGMWDRELFVRDEGGYEGCKIEVPSLFIGPQGESEMQVGFLQEWVTSLTVEEVKSGHWVHIEAADRVNALIEKFLGNHDM